MSIKPTYEELENQIKTLKETQAELKKTAAALSDSEKKYRNLVEESFDGIFIQKGSVIIFANKRFNEMLGYEDGELIGQKHWVVYHPDFQELTRERAQAIEYCRRKKMAFLFGLGIILTFVPFMSIPGDYYEAVSLVTTQVGEVTHPGLQPGFLVSDDVFLSIKQLWEAGNLDWMVGILVFIGLMLAAYLAFLTLAFQVWISNLFFGHDR